MALALRFSALSLAASVDQQTGNLSVFEVLEEIRTPQIPIHIQTLVISLALENTQPENFQGKVFIHHLTPDGKQHKIGSGDLNVPDAQRRIKAVFRFGAFPITAFGAHRIVVSWLDASNTKQGEAIFDFEVIQAAQVAPKATPSDKPNVTH
ncbi:MAG: hypothetical protein AB7P04_03950 [Bacteriovoracia bacterium]